MILLLIIPIIQLQFNTGEASQNVGNQDDEQLPGKTYLVWIEETFKLYKLKTFCVSDSDGLNLKSRQGIGRIWKSQKQKMGLRKLLLIWHKSRKEKQSTIIYIQNCGLTWVKKQASEKPMRNPVM